MKLAETQRWMFGKVIRPLTPDQHMRLVGEDGVELAEIDSIIAPNTKLSAFERLEVYNRQYWFRLFEAMDQDYPGLSKLLGQSQFRKLCEAYLAELPSASYTLRDLGSRLEGWLATHPQFGGKYPEATLDVARLEWAYVEAFDAAEYPTVTPEAVAAAGEEAKLRPQPHIRLVEVRCAVDEFTAETHEYDFGKRDRRYFGKSRFKALPEPFTVVVYRKDDHVAQLPIDSEAITLLTELADGKSLGDALESAFVGSSVTAEQIAPRVQRWFQTWSSLGWFTLAS
jgi:hypothetical protein